MKIWSVLRGFPFARTGIPLTAIVFAAGCASSPVTEHVEGKEVTVQIPVRTAAVFSRADAIASTRKYADSLQLPADLGSQATGIIDKNFGRLPETTRSEIAASAGQSRLVCANLESVLSKLLVPGQLYTHKNSWTHGSSIRAKTSGSSTITMCQGDGSFPTSATLTVRFAKMWDWRYQLTGGYCAACYADSFVELTLPVRFERVPQTTPGEEQLRLTFKLESVKDKVPRTPMGNAIAETHIDMDGFFATLKQLPNEYPRKGLEPENPYARTVAQTNDDLTALANKVANEQKAAKEAALTRWRAAIKTGNEGWVGPVSFGQYSGDLMMHALVVERRNELIRVQYDGRTDQNTAVSLREKEAWVKIRAFYPESEFKAGIASSVFQPNAMPMVR